MDRRATLSALIKFDKPLEELRAALAGFDWDSEPVVTLSRLDIAATLRRFTSGEIDARTVEAWADAIECRDDIQFEPGHEDVIASAIHDLANPTLEGQLNIIAPNVLAALSQRSFGGQMTRAYKTHLDVEYNQVAVFARGLTNPFNNWEERHVRQGFAWRSGSVSFRTLDNGPHLVDVFTTEFAGPLGHGVIRAVEVPFDVPGGGKLEIASISEAVELSLSPGKYLLRSEMFGRSGDIELIRLVFARMEIPRFSILVADSEISCDGPLLKEARAAR